MERNRRCNTNVDAVKEAKEVDDCDAGRDIEIYLSAQSFLNGRINVELALNPSAAFRSLLLRYTPFCRRGIKMPSIPNVDIVYLR